MNKQLILTILIAAAVIPGCKKTTNMNRLYFPPDVKVIYLSRRPIPPEFYERVEFAEETAAILSKLKKIERIENLDGVGQLRFLYLSDNLLTVIENLDNVPRLQLLDLSYNQIARIENLDKLPLLRILDLSSNQIERIENMGGLKNLSVLNLANNRIAHLANLENLASLEILDLGGNPLQSVSLPTYTFLTSRYVEIRYGETNLPSTNFFAVYPLQVADTDE